VNLQPQNDDRLLLLQVSKGNETAFAELYNLHWNKVYSIALLYLKSPDAAMDIVQETFLKVWTKREDLPELESFSAWLHTMARNLVIDSFRKKETYEKHILQAAAKEEGTFLPDQQLDSKQTAFFIHQAINNLPPRQQQVYKLSRIDGLKRSEVAERMNISPDTVREHMSKALKSVRAYLKEHLKLLILLFMHW
jgi:RNA polymerase sigma-70 factor (ECF subfamily)